MKEPAALSERWRVNICVWRWGKGCFYWTCDRLGQMRFSKKIVRTGEIVAPELFAFHGFFILTLDGEIAIRQKIAIKK